MQKKLQSYCYIRKKIKPTKPNNINKSLTCSSYCKILAVIIDTRIGFQQQVKNISLCSIEPFVYYPYLRVITKIDDVGRIELNSNGAMLIS